MLIGVVSDTHNNLKNIDQIISIFNQEHVELVVHTGDIASPDALNKFSKLNCELVGVYGNNDRGQDGLPGIAKINNFKFQDPPFTLKIDSKNIAIFHEPENIEEYLLENMNTDIVFHGHTHRYRYEYIRHTVLFNPGESAGFMKGKNAIGLVNLKKLKIKRIFF